MITATDNEITKNQTGWGFPQRGPIDMCLHMAIYRDYPDCYDDDDYTYRVLMRALTEMWSPDGLASLDLVFNNLRHFASEGQCKDAIATFVSHGWLHQQNPNQVTLGPGLRPYTWLDQDAKDWHDYIASQYGCSCVVCERFGLIGPLWRNE